MSSFEALSLFFKEMEFYSRVTLRNNHEVVVDKEPHKDDGDIQILSGRRYLNKFDAMGLIVHLMEKSGLTIENITKAQGELARVREEIKNIDPKYGTSADKRAVCFKENDHQLLLRLDK